MMNVESYQREKQRRRDAAWQPRPVCNRCKKSSLTCYCSELRPFESNPKFVILIHGAEVHRGVATGRMAHLCLKNSQFFEGTDFSHHEKVNAILEDPENYPVVLYPGQTATNLSSLSSEERKLFFPKDKKLIIFVLDATWAQAKRMKRLSKNIVRLPMVSFSPPTLSTFRVRKQPAENCYSTIEAIHHLIDLLGPAPNRAHDSLLHVFNSMVELQLNFERTNNPDSRRLRRLDMLANAAVL